MPCGDPRDCTSYGMYEKINEDLEKENLSLTRLLCFACGEITSGLCVEQTQNIFNSNPKLAQWWQNHYQDDEKRTVYQMKKTLQHEWNLGGKPKKKDVVDLFVKKAEDVHAVSSFHKKVFFDLCFDIAMEEMKRGLLV